MSIQKKITPCVFGILTRDNKVLLVKNKYKEFGSIWGIPGGKIEFGELIEDSLCREYREETGMRIKVGSLITTMQRFQVARQFHMIATIFKCTSDDQPKLVKNDSVTDWKFFSREELKNDDQVIMNRKLLISFLDDQNSLPDLINLGQKLDEGPIE